MDTGSKGEGSSAGRRLLPRYTSPLLLVGVAGVTGLATSGEGGRGREKREGEGGKGGREGRGKKGREGGSWAVRMNLRSKEN